MGVHPDFPHAMMRSLPCKRIECDEIWSFIQGLPFTVTRADL
jgi:hypothetical protein